MIEEINRDAGAKLLDRIGPAVLLTHSQAGVIGWSVADARPNLVKGILAIEPSGPPIRENVAKGAPDYFEDGAVARPWGVTRGKIAYDPPAETAGRPQARAARASGRPRSGALFSAGRAGAANSAPAGIPILILAERSLLSRAL